MVVNFYTTTKRHNSTATPSSAPALFSDPWPVDVNFKDSSNIIQPTLLIEVGGWSSHNYAAFFGRFYWIKSIDTIKNGLWLVHLELDALGSYRGHILNTSAFVLYDSTANTEIPDRRLGVKTTCHYSYSTADMPWSYGSGHAGQYFIAISGDRNGRNFITGAVESTSRGSTGVYQISKSDLNALSMDLGDFISALNTIDEQTATEINLIPDSDPIKGFKIFGIRLTQFIRYVKAAIIQLATGGDALKNIKSAYWLPFNVTSSGSVTAFSSLALGAFTSNTPANRIETPVINSFVTVGIPWRYNDWRNVSNTEVSVYIPMIGTINIPSSALKGSDSIMVQFSLNVYSGNLAVSLTAGGAQSTGECLGTYGTECAMPILIGDSNVNIGAVTNTVISAAATGISAATGNISGVAGGAAAVVASGYESLIPCPTSVGGIGGGAGTGLAPAIVCTCKSHDTSQEPSALRPIIGTPTMQLKKLENCPNGFIQTSGAELNTTAVIGESYPMADEVVLCNSLLNSGIFKE